MSIVSSTAERGSNHVVERHVDHLGNEYQQIWLCPADWTQGQVDAKVAEHAEQLLVQLAEAEAQQVVG